MSIEREHLRIVDAKPHYGSRSMPMNRQGVGPVFEKPHGQLQGSGHKAVNREGARGKSNQKATQPSISMHHADRIIKGSDHFVVGLETRWRVAGTIVVRFGIQTLTWLLHTGDCCEDPGGCTLNWSIGHTPDQATWIGGATSSPCLACLAWPGASV